MEDINLKIDQIIQSFTLDLESIKDLATYSAVETKYLGRKSEFFDLLKSLKDIPKEQRGAIGQILNTSKADFESKLSLKKEELQSSVSLSDLDVTAPGKVHSTGHLHLTTQAIKEITEIFQRIGFYRARYPEIDWDWYAFGGLNFPEDHPARDDWETYYVDKAPVNPKLGRRLFTPHTSNGQLREMESRKPPIRMINISKTGRRQITARHLPIFHQFEGLLIDEGINISHLKGVLDYFVREFFGSNRTIRIRPYNFRFTEPSFEVDVTCGNCEGKGCKLCKDGWVEIGGAGMIHPNVLINGGIDPKKYSGFAFGFGIERNMIMKEGKKIDDIRLVYQNDIRFLEQF